jgi:hypothetical protein
MGVNDLKKEIHQQVDLIEDVEFLSELEDLIKSRLGQSQMFEFSTEQLEAISRGRKQIKDGLGIDYKKVDMEIQKWLKEK